jgi:hypothetical protein
MQKSCEKLELGDKLNDIRWLHHQEEIIKTSEKMKNW